MFTRSLLLVAFAAAVSATVIGPLDAGQQDGRLDIYFVDVEGGAATLLVTPAGESILVDSGYPDNNGRDRDRILAVARSAGLKRIDHAVVTHWHLDHYGNHAALASEIPIGHFWDRGIPDALSEDPDFVDRVADYRRASENRSKALRPGEAIPLKSGTLPLSMTTVTASGEVIANTGQDNPFASQHVPQDVDTSDNAASLSLLLQFGKFKYLCCGDLTWNVEAKLVTPKNPLGQVDLFMVTHHGLQTSNNPVLVLAIDPKVAVMCNGPTKGGHADTQRTLRKVKSLQALYQLHRNIKLTADEQASAEFIANQEDTADCKGVFIKASVAADGESYTVQIGADGKPRVFETRK
jgi:beta-lactamase superfamily II metal-dependent hydrolase